MKYVLTTLWKNFDQSTEPAIYDTPAIPNADDIVAELNGLRFRLPSACLLSNKTDDRGRTYLELTWNQRSYSLYATRPPTVQPRLVGQWAQLTDPVTNDSDYAKSFLAGFKSDAEFARWVASLEKDDLEGEYTPYKGLIYQAFYTCRAGSFLAMSRYLHAATTVSFYGLTNAPGRERCLVMSSYIIGGDFLSTIVVYSHSDKPSDKELAHMGRWIASSIEKASSEPGVGE